MKRIVAVSAAFILVAAAKTTVAQTVAVGAGSYTTALPPGATGPPNTIFRTGTGPVRTHQFWTSKYWNALGTAPFAVNLFPDPWTVQVRANGLTAGDFGGLIVGDNGTGPGSFFYKPFQPDLTIGVQGLNATAVNVANPTDWMVEFNFGPLTTRVGRGMPFIYGLTNGSRPTVTFAGTPTVFANNANVLGVSIGGRNYGLFGPSGCTWTQSGNTFTCNQPAGANYFSVAALPNQAALNTYGGVAFSFPTNTRVSFSYNQSTSEVTTTYTVTTQAMQAAGANGFLMALYPHQYASLPGGVNTSFTYTSARGPMRVLSGTSFTTVDRFHGILPYLPATSNQSTATLQSLLTTVVNEADHFTASDTYGLGKQLGRIAQLLPIAARINSAQHNTLMSRLKAELQDWFNANGKSSRLFYYNSNWGTLIGYPASFGSDNALNDHHFHYGYWIHAAALIGLYDPGWIAANNFGGMVDLLRQDVANIDRANTRFPFMRNFDVYGGFSWASGQAPFGDGRNEESTSEAVNFWAGMILFAALTGNTQVRDAAIWAYTLETNSEFYYWFNAMPVRTFPAGINRVAVANVFDGKADAATWFGAQPAFVHGIEFLPFTPASLHLGRDPSYVQTNFNEVLNLSGGSLPDWPDLMQMYEAFVNPDDAFNRWSATGFVFDGETRAHEYSWIRSLQALGQVHHAVTANWPFYAVFRNPASGVITRVAFNPTSTIVTVNFSDGASLTVAAGALATDGGAGGGLPAAPTNLSATATSSSSINLSWTASTTSGVTYSIFRSTTNGFTPGPSNQIASGVGGTSFTNNTGLAPSTTYFYRVTAVNGAGSSQPSNQASATTSPAGLPAPWQNTDIGSVTPAGSASHSSGTFTVRGAGADIWGAADAFHYVYQSLTGDGEIAARVAGVQNTNAWAKAGVMMRESLSAGSKHAFMCVTPANGLAFQRRVATSGASTHTPGGSGAAPVWVRVRRIGNTLTGFRSSDGVNWTQVGVETISMAPQVFVGLAVTSHANGTVNTSTFDNVRVSAAGGSGPISINSGGGAVGSFVADSSFSGGSVASTTNAIDTSLISAPVPPQAVYQTERWGACTYTLGGFAPGSAHTVSLHFAEFFWNTAGQRKFNVTINGTRVLTDFDIIANTGAKNKAIQQNFSASANSSGQIVIQFSVGAVDQPKISGIVVQ